MKNRKRIVALLLTGTLAMSMLGGCGNEGSAESSGTSQGETSVSDGEKDSTENSDTADNDVQEGAAEKDENGLVVNPIEGEITVTVFKGMYQCQCGVDLIIQHQIFRADSQILKRFLQRHTELVFADFANKGSFFAEVVQHGEDVARSAAGICFEQSVALFAETILGKVDQ